MSALARASAVSNRIDCSAPTVGSQTPVQPSPRVTLTSTSSPSTGLSMVEETRWKESSAGPGSALSLAPHTMPS